MERGLLGNQNLFPRMSGGRWRPEEEGSAISTTRRLYKVALIQVSESRLGSIKETVEDIYYKTIPFVV